MPAGRASRHPPENVKPATTDSAETEKVRKELAQVEEEEREILKKGAISGEVLRAEGTGSYPLVGRSPKRRRPYNGSCTVIQ